MKVILLQRWATPEANRGPGTVVEVSPEVGDELITTKVATAFDVDPLLKSEEPTDGTETVGVVAVVPAGSTLGTVVAPTPARVRGGKLVTPSTIDGIPLIASRVE